MWAIKYPDGTLSGFTMPTAREAIDRFIVEGFKWESYLAQGFRVVLAGGTDDIPKESFDEIQKEIAASASNSNMNGSWAGQAEILLDAYTTALMRAEQAEGKLKELTTPRPMETAPKPCIPILVDNNRGSFIVQWSGEGIITPEDCDENSWIVWDGKKYRNLNGNDPIHWFPLPGSV